MASEGVTKVRSIVASNGVDDGGAAGAERRSV